MKKLHIIIALFCFQGFLKAQDTLYYSDIDPSSNYNQPYSPFENTLTMWILRQNFSLNALQANIGNAYPFSENSEKAISRTTFDIFLPVFNHNSFSSMLGTSYPKFPILAANDSLNKTLQDACRF